MTNQTNITPSEFETPHRNKPNNLINEKSPYLLQHAYNAVDWHPWGEAAFEKARAENKPIFLSIGYSTCHWCHVMERESFEDQKVGSLMNEAFIAVKVDREERPDIDAIYMQVAMTLNGQGGWPLNVLIMPDGKPFFAATYIPKEDRFGRAGLLTLIAKIQEIWLTDPSRILATILILHCAQFAFKKLSKLIGIGDQFRLIFTFNQHPCQIFSAAVPQQDSSTIA